MSGNNQGDQNLNSPTVTTGSDSGNASSNTTAPVIRRPGDAKSSRKMAIIKNLKGIARTVTERLNLMALPTPDQLERAARDLNEGMTKDELEKAMGILARLKEDQATRVPGVPIVLSSKVSVEQKRAVGLQRRVQLNKKVRPTIESGHLYEKLRVHEGWNLKPRRGHMTESEQLQAAYRASADKFGSHYVTMIATRETRANMSAAARKHHIPAINAFSAISAFFSHQLHSARRFR